MSHAHRSPFTSPLSTALGVLGIALFAAIATPSVRAQKLIADYPLLSDLKDATSNNGPVTLKGNPTPPAAPANGVCHNGKYWYATNGQDIRTPNLSSLNSTDFMFEIEFRLTALPTSTLGFPVIMAGNGWRWIGIYVSGSGAVGLKYNNSNHVWSKTILKAGQWYSAVVMYDSGACKLYIDGLVAYSATLPTLNTGSNLNFTTNDFSNGRAFYGCIRRFRIYNDAHMTGGLFTVAGSYCNNMQISGAMPWPQVTKPYTISVTGANPSTPAVLLLGFRLAQPIDLTMLGAKGCTWFVAPTLPISTAADSKGNASLILPMPNLLGAAAWFQWLSFSPTVNPLHWTMSDYATLVIGK